MTDVGQPREGSLVNAPQEAEPGNNTNFRDHKGQLERLEPPMADYKEVETSNTDDEPPDPPDSHPETTPEPMTMESRTDSLVPTPDSEGAGIGKCVKTFEQPQAVFGAVEVRQR